MNYRKTKFIKIFFILFMFSITLLTFPTNFLNSNLKPPSNYNNFAQIYNSKIHYDDNILNYKSINTNKDILKSVYKNYTDTNIKNVKQGMQIKLDIPYPGEGKKDLAATPNGVFTTDMRNYGYWKESPTGVPQSLAPTGGAWFLAGLLFPKATNSELSFLITSYARGIAHIILKIVVSRVKYQNGQYVDPYTRYFYVLLDGSQIYFCYYSQNSPVLSLELPVSIGYGEHKVTLRIYNGNYRNNAYTVKAFSISNSDNSNVKFSGIIFPKASQSKLSWFALAGKDTFIDFSIRSVYDMFGRNIRLYIDNILKKSSYLNHDIPNRFEWHLGDLMDPTNSSKERLVKVTLEIYFGGYSSIGWVLYSELFTHLSKYFEVDYSIGLLDHGALQQNLNRLLYLDLPYIQLYYMTHSFSRVVFVIDDVLPYSTNHDSKSVWLYLTYGMYKNLRSLYFDHKNDMYWDYLLIAHWFESRDSGLLGMYITKEHTPVYHRDPYNPQIYRDYGSMGVIIFMNAILHYFPSSPYAARSIAMHEVGHAHGVLYIKKSNDGRFYEKYSSYAYDVMAMASHYNTFYEMPFYSEFYWNLRLLFIYT